MTYIQYREKTGHMLIHDRDDEKDVDRDTEIDDILQDDSLTKEADEKEDKGSRKDREAEPPKDVRGAIKDAIRKHTDKDDRKSDKNSGIRTDSKKGTGVRSSQLGKSDEDSDDKDDKYSESKEEKTEKSVSSTQGKKVDPPPFWKNKGKATWEKLTPEQQETIVTREKEVSDGFAANSQKTRAYDELERVIAPRRQQIQQYGASEAAVIDRLFQWMENLAHQDVNHRANTFKALAQSFGVPLNQLTPAQQQQQESDADPVETQNNNPPQWALELHNRVQMQDQILSTQREETARNYLTNWATAKDKDGTPLRPHFETVRAHMHGLIAGGIVPLKDGQIDLDAAYEQACKVHPEVAALIQQEAATKAQRDAEAKATKEAKEKAARLLKAKSAGGSLRPSAPSLDSGQSRGGKPNGTGQKVSVRDSLKAAIDELRD